MAIKPVQMLTRATVSTELRMSFGLLGKAFFINKYFIYSNQTLHRAINSTDSD